MEVDFVFLADAADFCEWLDRAELVVGLHDGDERGLGADGSADGVGIYEAFSIDGQISDFDTLLFKSLAGV